MTTETLPRYGFAEAEQLKSLDLDARAVKVGAIDDAGMDKMLGLVLGCLVSPDSMIVSEKTIQLRVSVIGDALVDTGGSAAAPGEGDVSGSGGNESD